MINTDKTKMISWKYVAIVPVFTIGLLLLGCEDKMMTEVVELAKKSSTVNDYPKTIQDAVSALQKAHPEHKFLVVEPDERAIVTQAENLLSSSPRDSRAIQSITVFKDIKDDYGRLRSFLIIVYDERVQRIIETSAKEGVYSVVEVAPSFPGGLNAALLFVQKNISQEAMAVAGKNNLLGGSVLVKFIIEANGSLSGFEVIQGLLPELDQEALRVVKLMPNWTPARLKGAAVRVRNMIPVQFGSPTGKKMTLHTLESRVSGKPLNVTYNVTQDGAKRIITGKVVDFLNGKPLQGAIIVAVGGTLGVTTNPEGNFRFETTEVTQRLAVSFAGYETKVISF